MKYMDEFEGALTLSEFTALLGEHQKMYNFNYHKAEVDLFENDDLPPLKLLVISEPWCLDSTTILPVLQKLSEKHGIEIRVALRDKNPQLMDQFLTRGGRAVPIVVVLDSEGNYVSRFGPRPKKAQDIFEAHREDINAGKIEKSEVIKKIRRFYAQDRGKAIAAEFMGIIEKELLQNQD